jgi:hypothetical protein
LGHNSTFCHLQMQMRKKRYIFKHFAKSKKLFFANIYHSPCDSYWNSKKSIKLKPPSGHRHRHHSLLPVEDQGWEEGNGGESGHRHGHHSRQITRGVVQGEPQHEDGHACSQKNSGVDKDTEFLSCVTLLQKVAQSFLLDKKHYLDQK